MSAANLFPHLTSVFHFNSCGHNDDSDDDDDDDDDDDSNYDDDDDPTVVLLQNFSSGSLHILISSVNICRKH